MAKYEELQVKSEKVNNFELLEEEIRNLENDNKFLQTFKDRFVQGEKELTDLKQDLFNIKKEKESL